MTPDNSKAQEGVDYFHDIVQIDTSRTDPLPVTGEVDLLGNKTYTCRWKYRTVGGDDIFEAGRPINLATSEGEKNGRLSYFQDKYSGLKKSYGYGDFTEYVESLG